MASYNDDFIWKAWVCNEKDNLWGLLSWIQKCNKICAIPQKNDDTIKGQIVMLCLEGQELAVAEREMNLRQRNLLHKLGTG